MDLVEEEDDDEEAESKAEDVVQTPAEKNLKRKKNAPAEKVVCKYPKEKTPDVGKTATLVARPGYRLKQSARKGKKAVQNQEPSESLGSSDSEGLVHVHKTPAVSKVF